MRGTLEDLVLLIILFLFLILPGPFLVLCAVTGNEPIITLINIIFKGKPTGTPLRKWQRILVAVIGVLVWIIGWVTWYSLLCSVFPNLPICPPEPTPTPTPTPTPMDTPCIGRASDKAEFFPVYPNYDPSGYMGDIGDIKDPGKYPEVVSFTYEAIGRGPHEWEWKYVSGELNPNPARFAGVMYLCCGWGERPGFDLRAFRRAIAWEARSLSGEVNVEFVIGGIDWVWDEKNKVRVPPPCPDSLRRKSLGIYTLTEEWQSFKVDLSTIPEEEFMNVIGGFAWVITWGSNGIELNPTATPPAPKETKTFVIEIRNIRYER